MGTEDYDSWKRLKMDFTAFQNEGDFNRVMGKIYRHLPPNPLIGLDSLSSFVPVAPFRDPNKPDHKGLAKAIYSGQVFQRDTWYDKRDTRDLPLEQWLEKPTRSASERFESGETRKASAIESAALVQAPRLA